MAFNSFNLQNLISDFFTENGNIEHLRRVEWAKRYLWIVDFDGFKPPAPFDNFFPANDIQVPMSIVESRQIDLPNDSLNIPIRTTQRDLRITFYDDSNNTLLRWFTDWQKLDILNLDMFVSCLGDSHDTVAPDSSFGKVRPVVPVRQIKLALLNPGRDQVLVKNFWVYPDGEILFSGNQQSEAQTYTVNFKIVQDGIPGKVEQPFNSGDNRIGLPQVKRVLSRFF